MAKSFMVKKLSLCQRLRKLGIRDEDLVERFIRASGPGGQKVNKSSSCVYLRHLPSGLEVKCQEERSQSLNRYLARRILLEKMEAKRDKAQKKHKQFLRKEKAQKRLPSRAEKEKMRRIKEKRGKQKRERSFKVKPEEY